MYFVAFYLQACNGIDADVFSFGGCYVPCSNA